MSRARKDWLEWFRVDRDLIDHPKTLALASLHGNSVDVAIGQVVRMWAWTARHAPDGALSPADLCHMNVIGIEVEKLQEAGFIDESGTCNWLKFNGYAMNHRNHERSRYEQKRSILPQNSRRPSQLCHPRARDGDGKDLTSPIGDGVGVDLFQEEAQKQERAKELDREWEGAFSEHFWPVYPRKVAKAAALRVWKPIIRGVNGMDTAEKLLGRVMDGLERDIATEWRGRDPDKIPHAATWLNQRRWEDER